MTARQLTSAPAPKADGFTRIDLLLVLAIGGLLVLTQAPALGSHRLHAEAAVCIDNLHRLTGAWLRYAAENDNWFPPNPDDGNTTPGYNWVAGQAGRGGAQEFDAGLLTDPSRTLVAPYLGGDAEVFRCPSDPRRGRPPRPTPEVPPGNVVPAARSVSANNAVGTDPYSGGRLPTHGPWLDGNHSHTRGRKWFTYGRVDDMVQPTPAKLFLLIDEDEASLNDGVFANAMEQSKWIDFPGTRHDFAATVGFGDGHVELHRWTDPRTPVTGGYVSIRPVPGSPDLVWLQERTSALIPR